MTWRFISSPKRVLLVGVIALGGFVAVASQRSPGPARATLAPQSDTQVPAKSLSTDIATSKMPLTAEPSSAGAKQSSVSQDNALWSIPLASLAATRERPIFSPTRRSAPVVLKSAPIQAPSATQPPLALVGAIAGDDEGIAIFLDGTTKGVIRLKTGESHAGWTLQVVKAREVILEKEQRTATLTLPNPSAK